MADFSIHVDAKNDSLNTEFNLLLESIGFSQNVKEPTQHFHHTLDLVLTYGIETEHLTIFPKLSLFWLFPDNISIYNIGLHSSRE